MSTRQPGLGYAPEFRVQVMQELESKSLSLTEVCLRYQITMHTLLHWRELFREGGSAALVAPPQRGRRPQPKHEEPPLTLEPPSVPLPHTVEEQERAKDELIIQLSLQLQQLQQENALLKKVWRLLPSRSGKDGSIC